MELDDQLLTYWLL